MKASHGIGSRLRVLTLAIHRRESVEWQLNQHCKTPFLDVFPEGIHGLEVTEVIGGINTGHMAKPGDTTDGFAHVWNSLQIPRAPRVPLAIHYRAHWVPGMTMPFDAFAAMVQSQIQGATQPIPMAADSRRDDIMALSPLIMAQESKEMESDLDRPVDQTRRYLSDLARILPADRIVTNADKSSVTWLHEAYRRAFIV